MPPSCGGRPSADSLLFRAPCSQPPLTLRPTSSSPPRCKRPFSMSRTPAAGTQPASQPVRSTVLHCIASALRSLLTLFLAAWAWVVGRRTATAVRGGGSLAPGASAAAAVARVPQAAGDPCSPYRQQQPQQQHQQQLRQQGSQREGQRQHQCQQASAAQKQKQPQQCQQSQRRQQQWKGACAVVRGQPPAGLTPGASPSWAPLPPWAGAVFWVEGRWVRYVQMQPPMLGGRSVSARPQLPRMGQRARPAASRPVRQLPRVGATALRAGCRGRQQQYSMLIWGPSRSMCANDGAEIRMHLAEAAQEYHGWNVHGAWQTVAGGCMWWEGDHVRVSMGG